jgi:hypothetical protein
MIAYTDNGDMVLAVLWKWKMQDAKDASASNDFSLHKSSSLDDLFEMFFPKNYPIDILLVAVKNNVNMVSYYFWWQPFKVHLTVTFEVMRMPIFFIGPILA